MSRTSRLSKATQGIAFDLRVIDILGNRHCMGFERAARCADHDLRAARREYVFKIPSSLSRLLLARYLKDERDEPLATCLFNILSFLPVTICTFCVSSHCLGAAHFIALYALFLQRFMLALHYSQHRPIFRRGSMLAPLLPTALTPLFGLPIGSYHVHHCLMHHQVLLQHGLSTKSCKLSTRLLTRDTNSIYFSHTG